MVVSSSCSDHFTPHLCKDNVRFAHGNPMCIWLYVKEHTNQSRCWIFPSASSWTVVRSFRHWQTCWRNRLEGLEKNWHKSQCWLTGVQITYVIKWLKGMVISSYKNSIYTAYTHLGDTVLLEFCEVILAFSAILASISFFFSAISFSCWNIFIVLLFFCSCSGLDIQPPRPLQITKTINRIVDNVYSITLSTSLFFYYSFWWRIWRVTFILKFKCIFKQYMTIKVSTKTFDTNI